MSSKTGEIPSDNLFGRTQQLDNPAYRDRSKSPRVGQSRIHNYQQKQVGFKEMMDDRNSAYQDFQEEEKLPVKDDFESPKMVDPSQLLMERDKSYVSNKNSINERQSDNDSHDFSQASQELVDHQNGLKKQEPNKKAALNLNN